MSDAFCDSVTVELGLPAVRYTDGRSNSVQSEQDTLTNDRHSHTNCYKDRHWCKLYLIGFGGLVVWFGLVWFGLVWFGLVWFGLVWFG
jgi:hypothetical protein